MTSLSPFHDRLITPDDKPLLASSLAADSYHRDTTPEFFYAQGTECSVYHEDAVAVLFCRATKALRLDIQFINNRDYVRNRAVMLEGFPKLAAKAQAAGFTEIIFNTTSPLLRRFCEKKLGFVSSEGELRKILKRPPHANA